MARIPHATIYSTLLSLEESNVPPQTKEEDAGHFQARQNWLNSTITREHLDELNVKLNTSIYAAFSAVKVAPICVDVVMRHLHEANALLDVIKLYNKSEN